MAKKYNPYNDYKKIVGYKGDWHNAKSFGQDPNQYYQSAMPYYQSLIDNGYSELAQDLTNSDYTQSKGLLGKYGLKPDNEFYLDDDYNNLIGEGSGSAGIINAAHPNDSYINDLMNLGNGTGGMAQQAFTDAQGIATGTVPIQPSAATQGILDAYMNDQNRLNGEIKYDANGNVVSGLNTEHYNIGRNQLDYYNNFDITAQPYYKGIMDQYKLGGQNAANNAYANGAANNAGNIDSYAAANANRQQLAFTTAGQQAALAAAQQNATNWNNLYAQMSNDLYNQGNLSLGTLGVARDMYAKDAEERMNALDTEGALASQQMQSSIAAFEKLVEERMADKGISAEMAMQEADIAAAKEQLELQLASDERVQEGINATNRYTSDNDLKGTMYTSDNALKGNMYSADRDLEGRKYSADTELAGTRYKTDADLATAKMQDAYNRYAENHNYQLRKQEIENDINKILAQGQVDKELSQLTYDQQLELLANGYTYDSKGNPVEADNNNGNGTTGDQMTYDETLQMATALMSELNPKDLIDLGLDKVQNETQLTAWFQQWLSPEDAQKATKYVLDKTSGDPKILTKISNKIEEYIKEQIRKQHPAADV